MVITQRNWTGAPGSGAGLAFGVAWLLEPLVNDVPTSVNLEAGPTLYLSAVMCSVVITEQLLRRRDVGPVTLDMVHAGADADADNLPSR